MAARTYNVERWSPEEDQQLRSMSESGKSLTLISARLKKPMKAIVARASSLHIAIAGTGIGQRSRR